VVARGGRSFGVSKSTCVGSPLATKDGEIVTWAPAVGASATPTRSAATRGTTRRARHRPGRLDGGTMSSRISTRGRAAGRV
jgi:hypothetical protein